MYTISILSHSASASPSQHNCSTSTRRLKYADRAGLSNCHEIRYRKFLTIKIHKSKNTVWQPQYRHIHPVPVSLLSMADDRIFCFLHHSFPILSCRRPCGNNVVDLERLKASSRLSIGLILKGGRVLHWNHHRLIVQFKNETDLQCWWHSTFAAVLLIRNLSKK